MGISWFFSKKANLTAKIRNAIREDIPMFPPAWKRSMGFLLFQTPLLEERDDFFRTLSQIPARVPGIRMFLLSSGGIAR